MDTAYISGPISCYILSYNNVKYYLFGDVHTAPAINPCSNPNCDSINYLFNDINITDSQCWSIGALLAEWFIFNNDHNIRTDFYLEVPFTKEDSRTRIQILTNIITHRRNSGIILENNDIIDPVSVLWILSLELYFHDCLIHNKSLCQYSPNVRFHYTDTRLTDEKDINIFLIGDISTIIIPLNNPNEFIALLSVIQFLADNAWDIINKIYMSAESLYDTIQYLNNLLVIDDNTLAAKLFREKLQDTMIMQVVRNNLVIHRTAAELHRVNPEIRNSIRSYIRGEVINVANILSETLEELIYIIEESSDNSVIELYLPSLMSGLASLSSFDMDIYTLSRMFLQNSQEVIVYAGQHHCERYYNFFGDYLGGTVLYSSEWTSDPYQNIKCVNPDLRYLNPYQFRNYIRYKL